MISKTQTTQFILLVGFIFYVDCNEGDSLIRLLPKQSISITSDLPSSLGVVPGARSCGGPAEVLEWRYESCNGTAICQIPSDSKAKRGEFTFVPSENIPDGLGIRFNVSAEDIPTRSYELSLPDSAVFGGQSYTVMSGGSPTKEFQGKTMTFQYILYRLRDNSVEVCMETEFQNV